MIDWQKFNEMFQYSDKDFIRMIIDQFEYGDDTDPSYEQRKENISKAIELDDFLGIKFHVHSLKGVAGNFHDHEPYELGSILERMGIQKTVEGLDEEETFKLEAELAIKGLTNNLEGRKEIFEQFKVSMQKLFSQLHEYKKTLK